MSSSCSASVRSSSSLPTARSERGPGAAWHHRERRMTRPIALLIVQIVVVTAILACLVALAALHPWRLDLTPERRFTLSPYTREVLARITGEVRITAFYSSQEPAMRREMADLLALHHHPPPDPALHLLD